MSDGTNGAPTAPEAQDEIIRAKGILDGAATLAEAVVKAHDFAFYLQGLHDRGYALEGPVEDDYGFCSKAAR
jgi:hypothetical protein